MLYLNQPVAVVIIMFPSLSLSTVYYNVYALVYLIPIILTIYYIQYLNINSNYHALIYRRDSFITHRAFCDAIAEENNKATSLQRQISSNQISSQPELISSIISSINDENDTTPTETTSDQFKHISEHMMIKNPLTLDHQPLNTNNMAAGNLFSRSSLSNMIINNTGTNISSSAPMSFDQQNGHHFGGGEQFYLSATALLQKAAQMGTTTVSSANSTMAPSTYATLDHQFIKKDPTLQEYQMSSSNTNTITIPQPLPPQFFDVNGNPNTNKNGDNKNVGIFGGLLFDHQNHAGSTTNATTFLKDMEQSMNNDNNSNVVLHGGNSNVSGGDVMTVDFLGIGRSARQGNFHEQKKQLVVNNLRFGAMNNGHPNMQSTLTQFQQHAGLMEKHVWEI